MGRKRVEQKDISEKLGLAPTTVSKVLNHDPFFRVSAETRELILKTAKEMGFALKKRRTHNIAFVVGDVLWQGHQEMHRVASSFAAEHGYRTFLVQSGPYPSYRDLVKAVNPLSVDGVMLVGHFSDDVIARLTEILPTVLSDERPHDVAVDRVYTDYLACAGRLTAHLLNLGHRRIAMTVYDMDAMISRAQVEGHREVLESAGIELDMSLVWQRSSVSLADIVREILEHPSKPTAILSDSSEEHLVMLSVLRAHGVEVPRDISYVAWDNLFMSGLRFYADISCLDDYFGSIARAAVRRLIERMGNSFLPAQDIQVEVRMHEGKTCARIDANARPRVLAGG